MGWSLDKSRELYGIKNWGEGYFDINSKGNVVVKPDRSQNGGDLYELVQSLVQRGIEAPILLRFNGIIKDRLHSLQKAFQSAIEKLEYKNYYHAAYPVKVNPQAHIVELIHREGAHSHLGLEVGSKPELIAALCINGNKESLLLCNGYKDVEYIELALLSAKLGRHTIITIEQFYELKLVIDTAERLGMEANIGLRLKLSTKGAGKWQSSGGELAKFGLTPQEILQAVEYLKSRDKSHWLQLLHYHMGSQVPSIYSINNALSEATRMYTELALMHPSMKYFDIGGGLGIDYDGTKTNTDNSINYTLEEYAYDAVLTIKDGCTKANVPHPIIVSESGRSLVAHHSILITEVIDVSPTLDVVEEIERPPCSHYLLENLYTLYKEIQPQNCEEILQIASDLREGIRHSFIHGDLNLKDRAYADKVHRHLIAKILKASKELKQMSPEVKKLDKNFLDLYFCNLSVFQSLPDSWAIQQLFPIMPIHKHLSEPSRRAIIADLSCDSDGSIDQFIGPEQDNYFLRLHEFNECGSNGSAGANTANVANAAAGANEHTPANPSPYYLGIFLVGAYQEILGGLHNLFGDTNAIHLDIDSAGNWDILSVVEGDSIGEVLQYVQYDLQDLNESLQQTIEHSLKAGRLTPEESAKLKKKIKESLASYTYIIM